MNKRVENLLDCFDPDMQKGLLDFCDRISKMQVDVFILMARKASCFFNCLEELGLVNFSGYVTSERILDMDCEWLRGKSVAIIDDAIVSGTSINRTINKLIEAGVDKIEVHVLTVNEKWFNEELLKDEHGKSYLYPKCNVETNEKCIDLCYRVVKSILLLPRPYDIDFPYFKGIEVKEKDMGWLMNRDGWDCYNISSVEQVENKILVLTIIPTETELEVYKRRINASFLDKCLVKIRLYATYKDKNKKMYSIRVVPMIVFDRIPIGVVEKIFNEIVEQIDETQLFKGMFTSTTSKLRFLQFYYSVKFAEFWIEGLPQIIGVSRDNLIFEDRNLSFIFPEQIEREIADLCKDSNFYMNQYDTYEAVCETSDVESSIDGIDIISVETRLMEPFIDKYYNKELPCRDLVFEKGREVFDNPEYDELLQRLNKGVTICDLMRRIEFAKNYYDVQTRVSLFVDRAIDMGIIVPITQINKEYVFRAFRHGEDVLFGKREEILYLKMLHEFEVSARNGDGITHISAEKMIVLFSKIALDKKILKPYYGNFTINPRDDNGAICRVLRVKTFLKGPIAVLGDVRAHMRTKEIPYITEEGKSVWFTNTYIQKESILCTENDLYHIPEVDTSSIDQAELSDVENIAIMFGELCNSDIDTGITLGDDELTKIATCLNIEDTIKAIAAEISVFIKEWAYSPLSHTSEKDSIILNSYKKSRAYEAINSGHMKLTSYENGEAKDIIKKVKFQNRVVQNTWESWFNDILQERNGSESLNENVVNLFNESKYLVYVTLCAYHMMIVLQFIEYKSYDNNKRYGYVKDSYEKMDKYFQALQTMTIPAGFVGVVDWRMIKDMYDEVRGEYTIEKLMKGIVKDPGKEYFKTIIKQISVLINESNNYLERVCAVFGGSGRIHDKQVYQHVLAVTYRYYNDLEDEYIRNCVDRCFQKILEIKIRNAGGQTQGENVDIEYLPSKLHPDIELDKEMRTIWFVAKGDCEVLMAKLALNIASVLKNTVKFKVAYMGDISYKYSVIKYEPYAAEFSCNAFYSFIEEFPMTAFQIQDDVSIVAIVDENNYKKNNFMNFINTEAIGKAGCARKGTKTIEIKGSRYTMDLLEQKKTNKSGEDKYVSKKDIGVLTILDEEAAAVIKLMELKEDPFQMGKRSYYSGYLEGQGVTHSIVMTQQISQGEISIVTAYNDMVREYKPSIIFLVGIAGGLTKNVNYCNVVLAQQIISYDLCKDTQNGIQRRGDVNKINSEIMPVYQRLIQRIKMQPIKAATGSLDESIHVVQSNIASGSAVIANKLSDIRKWIHEYNDKTDATEMEAYGLTTAFYEGTLSGKRPKYGVAVIRGISDMAEEDKDSVKQYRIPAAENAVLVLKDLIKLLPKL